MIGIMPCAAASSRTDVPCPRLPDPEVGFDPADPAFVNALLQVDSLMEAGRKAEGAPGMLAQVVVGGEVVWFKGYGHVNASDLTSPPPGRDTLVMIASITKVSGVDVHKDDGEWLSGAGQV